MSVSIPRPDYDLKNAVTPNRLRSLWRLATGFHTTFIAATIALGLAASLAAHFTWSVTDALVIGARGQLPFWMLLASVVALHRTAVTHDAEAMRRGGPPGPNEGAAVPDLNVLVNRES